MEFRRITDQKQIETIFREHMQQDFPADEITPWIYMERMLQEGQYVCCGLFEQETLLGYAFFMRSVASAKQYYLLDYLAIRKGHRNSGLGTTFLKLLSDQFSDVDCMICEVEDPDAAETEDDCALRERRIGFYRRNGFYETAVKAEIRGVAYRLLETPTGPPHSAGEIREIYEAIYSSVASDVFMQQFFKIKEP